MLFNSGQFLIFFPVVLLINYILPKKIRYIWLLICSYFFYMCWNPKYVILLFSSTFITYLSGLAIDYFRNKKNESDKKKMNMVVAVSFLTNLGILAYFKYTDFFIDLFVKLGGIFRIELNAPVFDIVLPVGISFYIFQALSYTMDIYRGDIEAEKNIFRYALFVSFFPQLVAGPIERSKNLLKQLAEPKSFSFERFKDGFLLMLWGFFLKIVLADRIAIFVDNAYNNPDTFGGWYLIIATILFAVQIYCDFAGYSTIAMGAAKILGVELMENFNAPYLSTNVAEFWRNWHISLTGWFKDYLYIPLGGSRKGKVRKYINKMIVFLVSGLWHGASLSFVVWGGLNGLYQVVGEILMPVRRKFSEKLELVTDGIAHRIFAVLATFILVDFSWIFFRAGSIGKSFEIIKSMATTHNFWILVDESIFKCGLDRKNFYLMIFCIFILLLSDMCKKKGLVVRSIIMKQNLWFRCLATSTAICFILIFGIWGPAYNAANFIYFQF